MDPRNQNLNAAYRPKWGAVDALNPVNVPQGDTRFDPFVGTGWGDWLDAMGAKEPGGVKLNMAVGGLRQSPTPTSQEPGPDPLIAKNRRNPLFKQAMAQYDREYPGWKD